MTLQCAPVQRHSFLASYFDLITYCMLDFQLELEESSGGLGKLVENAKQTEGHTVMRIPCIPVETLLLALNRTTVDYFSLDVEGMENDVVHTIDHKKFNIRTWSIEYAHTAAFAMKQYMIRAGYKFVKQLNVYDQKVGLVVEDYVFKKGSLQTSMVLRIFNLR